MTEADNHTHFVKHRDGNCIAPPIIQHEFLQ